MALDDQDLISDVEHAITLLKSALQKASGKDLLILKQLQLATETAERCDQPPRSGSVSLLVH